MSRQKKQLYVSILILFSISISIYAFFPSINIDRNEDDEFALNSADSYSSVIILNYNRYYGVHSYANNCIKWEIDGTPIYIDIIVLLMDSYEYSNFRSQAWNTDLTSTVNSGTYPKITNETSSFYSGGCNVQYSGTWYIVFVNLDNSQLATTLEYDIEWDPLEKDFFLGNLPVITMILIGIISILAIIICGVVVSSRHKRESAISESNYLYKYKSDVLISHSDSIMTTEHQESFNIEEKKINFCIFCGEKPDLDAVFCPQCGTKL